MIFTLELVIVGKRFLAKPLTVAMQLKAMTAGSPPQ
jgi:ABC-type tungstate transport system substrate-binding protein